MARLISSGYNQALDEQAAVWPGSPHECLGKALEYFRSQAVEEAQAIVDRVQDNIPHVIRQRAIQTLGEAQKGALEIQYTVVSHGNGELTIYLGEGPDHYKLIG